MSALERPQDSSFSESSGISSRPFSNAPYWLIVGDAAEGDSPKGSRNRAASTPEVLSLDLAEGRVLPVFGSEEGAALFIRAWMTRASATGSDTVDDQASVDGVGSEWRPRGTGAGELISLLSGSAFLAPPCAGVERVALDPPPELLNGPKRGLNGGDTSELVSVGRKSFVEHLMGRGRAWFDGVREK